MRSAQVVFVNRYFFPDESATSRILSDLAFRLAARGLSVSVLTSRQLYGDPRASLPPVENIRGVTVRRVLTATRGRSRLAGRALDYASFHVAAGLELLRLLSPGDVVVAKTDPPLISIAVSAAARWRGAVLVNWLQDLFPEVASILTPNLMPTWLQRQLTAARNRSLRQAAMNVVLGEGMRVRLVSYGVDDKRVSVIPNWADVEGLKPLSTAESHTRRRLGLDGQFVVGYSGNLGRAHEFDTLLQAAQLLRADPGFTFLITGDGAKAQQLRRAVENGGLPNFIFQDYQPPQLLADSLAASDVHVVSLLPALEGLIVPSKIYGVLAAGRPAVFIGDPNGDVAKMIRDPECGISVRVGDAETLAAELRALRDDPLRLASMSARARAHVVSRCTSEHAVSDWLGFLDDIAPQLHTPCNSNVTARA